MQFLRSFPFTSLNTSFCATPLWFVPLNTTLALHPVTAFRSAPGDICEQSGAPLCPELNLALTVPLLITTCSADHTGLQWTVSCYCRCCCISPATLARQGECVH